MTFLHKTRNYPLQAFNIIPKKIDDFFPNLQSAIYHFSLWQLIIHLIAHECSKLQNIVNFVIF